MRVRIISAVIALIISIPLVYVGGIPFYLFSILLSLLGFREIINLAIQDNWGLKMISYVSFLGIIGSNLAKTTFDGVLNYQIIGVIFLLFFMTLLFQHRNKHNDVGKCFYALGLTMFLGLSFSLIIIVRNMSLYYFIYLFLITVMTDTFAHSTGTLFGKHKINEISPNKSWEGCLGGACFGTLISVLFYLIMINQDINIFLLVGITLFLSIIGQLGDLFFSYIKRQYQIKDYSNIMPGHGGILDRFDSIIFVMLAFTYFITFL